MKLKCTESVIMKDDGEQVFTKGKLYNARKGSCQGLNGDPYEFVGVLRAKNDVGDSHIIRELDSDRLDEFFNKHFTQIK